MLKKLPASSPLVLILLLAAIIIALIAFSRSGLLVQNKATKDQATIDLNKIERTTDKYNQQIQNELNQ